MNLLEILVEALTDFFEQSAETIGTFLATKDGEKPDTHKINALLGIPDPTDDALSGDTFARLLAREQAAEAAAKAEAATKEKAAQDGKEEGDGH